LIKKRNNAFKRHRKTGLYYFKIKYNVARNVVTKEIRRAKSKYEAKVVKRSKNNRNVFYSYLATKNRKTVGKKVGPIVKVGIDGKEKVIVTKDVEVASLLNEYFSSVYNKKEIKKAYVDFSEISSQRKELRNITISDREVEEAIGSFKANKSPGVDGISSTYALKLKKIISKPLAYIFNRSLKCNEIPADWKKAIVVPIFKKGERSNMENYRPVSLTVLFVKTMEKILKNKIKFLETNNSIRNSQHGFTKGRSCLSNLLTCQDSIMKILDEGSAVDIVYLDLQKAFDKVPHDQLIKKVREIGITGEIADWIENWLTDRVQMVAVNGNNSDWTEVCSGVLPQGSVLGPLLFSIFINDLDKNVTNSVLKFADDTKIWGRANDNEDTRKMQNDLLQLSVWSEENSMPFNIDKCKVMHIGSKNMKMEYMLSGKKIKETKEEKDLGVIFTDSLKPSTNCDKVCKAARKIVGLIRRNIINKAEEEMLILYKTLVRPTLDYCIPVWRPYQRKDINKLEGIQKRYTKIIKGYKALNYKQRLNKLGLTTLEERHHRADMIQVYKILHDKADTYPKDLLTLSDRPGRKNCLKLYKKRNRLNVCKHSFVSRVVDSWNDLPDEIVTSDDVKMFKSRFDCHMRDVRGQI